MEPYDVIVNQPVVIDNVSAYHFIEKNLIAFFVFMLMKVMCQILQNDIDCKLRGNN